jgi:hypothetical protein
LPGGSRGLGDVYKRQVGTRTLVQGLGHFFTNEIQGDAGAVAGDNQ